MMIQAIIKEGSPDQHLFEGTEARGGDTKLVKRFVSTFRSSLAQFHCGSVYVVGAHVVHFEPSEKTIGIETNLKTGVICIARKIIELVRVDLTTDQGRQMTRSGAFDCADNGCDNYCLHFIR